MNHWGVSPCCTNPPVANADHRNDTNTPTNATESYPHRSNPPRSSRVTNVCPTSAIVTHNFAKPLYPKTVAPPLAPAVHQCPTSRRCGHARHRSATTPRSDAQTTHRVRAIVLCALRRPACPQSNAFGRHQAGMPPQQRKHIGCHSAILRGHTRPTTSPTKGKRQVPEQAHPDNGNTM